jgi:hypothetical protein
MTAGNRVTALALTPLWLACTAGWGATSAVLLTWTAAREGVDHAVSLRLGRGRDEAGPATGSSVTWSHAA